MPECFEGKIKRYRKYKLNNPKVSVCVITRNHERYINQCLQSIVNQKTNFDFELIIGNDFSRDKTSQIIDNFPYPRGINVKIIHHPIQIGGTANYFSVHNIAIGEYIAHIDGDDLMLPNKLQIQATFLDESKTCNVVFHNCKSLFQNGEIHESPMINYKSDLHMEYFLYRFRSNTWHSSKMYRKSVRNKICHKEREILDKHLHFAHAKDSPVGYINEPLGIYRHGVGISMNVKMVHDLAQDAYKYAADHGYDKKILAKLAARESFEYGIHSLEAGDNSTFSKSTKEAFKMGHITGRSLLALLFSDMPATYLYSRRRLRILRDNLFIRK